MPKSDFLIGLEAGSEFVGGIVADKQRQAQLDVQKKQLELENRARESTLSLQRDQLNEQIAHHSKLEEYNAAQIEGMKLERDWKINARKNEVAGLARVMSFDTELTDSMLKDPTGSQFWTVGSNLRTKYTDLFAHENEKVRLAAQAVERRGLEFLKSAEVAAMNKDVADLVIGGFLNPLEREDPTSVANARKTRDDSWARALAQQNGINIDEAVKPEMLSTPELSALGGWSPAFKAFVQKQIETTAKAKTELSQAPDAKVTLNIPADQAPADGDSIAKDLMSGGKKTGNVMTIETTLKEIQRSPFLRSIYDTTLNKAGRNDLTKDAGERLVVEVNGVRGTMLKKDFDTNIRMGKNVKVLGNAP